MGPSIRIGFSAALVRGIGFPPSPVPRLSVLDQEPKIEALGLGLPTLSSTQHPTEVSENDWASSGGPGSPEGFKRE